MTGFNLLLETGKDSYKQLPKCTPDGQRTTYPGLSSALVPLEQENIVVELPEHRCFFLVGNDTLTPISGMVNLPVMTSTSVMVDLFLKPGSIIEVDSRFLGPEDFYLYKKDINSYFVRNSTTYLLSAQLILIRGSKVT